MQDGNSQPKAERAVFLPDPEVYTDVVIPDLDLYAKIDGIETSLIIRTRFDIPVWYK